MKTPTNMAAERMNFANTPRLGCLPLSVASRGGTRSSHSAGCPAMSPTPPSRGEPNPKEPSFLITSPSDLRTIPRGSSCCSSFSIALCPLGELARDFDRVENVCDYGVDGRDLVLRADAQRDTVAKDRARDVAHVVGRGEVAAAHRRERLRAEEQRDARARARAVRDRRVLARAPHDVNQIAAHALFHTGRGHLCAA